MIDDQSWGLVGSGRHGAIAIDIHESLNGPEAWELVLNMPNAYLRVPISGPLTVNRMYEFLKEERTEWGQIEIGIISNHEVLLVRDHPPVDRSWIKVIFDDGLLSFTFADAEAESLREALRDLLSDLDDS